MGHLTESSLGPAETKSPMSQRRKVGSEGIQHKSESKPVCLSVSLPTSLFLVLSRGLVSSKPKALSLHSSAFVAPSHSYLPLPLPSLTPGH